MCCEAGSLGGSFPTICRRERRCFGGSARGATGRLLAGSCNGLVQSQTQRGVVDADMDELPARALAFRARLALPPAVPGDAVADLVEATELLDVDVDELAGMLAFVA